MEAMMLSPKSRRLFIWNGHKKRLADLIETFDDLQAIVQVFDDLEGNDNVPLLEFDLIDISANEVVIIVLVVIFCHFYNLFIVVNT